RSDVLPLEALARAERQLRKARYSLLGCMQAFCFPGKSFGAPIRQFAVKLMPSRAHGEIRVRLEVGLEEFVDIGIPCLGVCNIDGWLSCLIPTLAGDRGQQNSKNRGRHKHKQKFG